MPRPNKPKILRKISDTQLTLNTNSYSNVTGVTSATSCSTSEYCFVGKSNLKDIIDACVAIQASGTHSGADVGPWSSGHPNGEGNRSGGGASGGAGCGSPFIFSKVNTFNNGSWCFKRPGCSIVGASRTSTFFCNVLDSSLGILSCASTSGCNANGGGVSHNPQGHDHYEHQASNGNPGTLGAAATTISNTAGVFYDVCNVAGSGCCSGYLQSSYSGTLVPSPLNVFGTVVPRANATFHTSSGESHHTTLRSCPGWVHIKSTGRNDNVNE